jgi:hypothetical protein
MGISHRGYTEVGMLLCVICEDLTLCCYYCEYFPYDKGLTLVGELGAAAAGEVKLATSWMRAGAYTCSHFR